MPRPNTQSLYTFLLATLMALALVACGQRVTMVPGNIGTITCLANGQVKASATLYGPNAQYALNGGPPVSFNDSFSILLDGTKPWSVVISNDNAANTFSGSAGPCEQPGTTTMKATTTTAGNTTTTAANTTTTEKICEDCTPNTQGATTTTSSTLPTSTTTTVPPSTSGPTTTIPGSTTTSIGTTTTTTAGIPPITGPADAPFAFGAAASVCVSEVPTIRIVFQNRFPELAGRTGTLTMADVRGNVVSTQPLVYQPGTTVDLLYPGTRVNADGSIADVPGWNLNSSGFWVRDPSDEFLREGISLTYTVNPTATAFVTYPPESSTCANPDGPFPPTATPVTSPPFGLPPTR